MDHDRRTFLAALGAAALGVWRPGALAALMRTPVAPTKLSKIGIQLYTVRRPAAADLAGTLARLAKIGYKEVEFAGYYNHSAAEFRDLLKQNGLTAPSGHIAIDLIENDPAKTFADAQRSATSGSRCRRCRAASRDRGRLEGRRRRFNKAAAQAKAAGFRFAFHNHTDIVEAESVKCCRSTS